MNEKLDYKKAGLKTENEGSPKLTKKGIQTQ